MTIPTKTHRALAVLSLPRNVSALITYAVGLVKGMTGNAYFPTPTPPLATVQTAVADLQTAETGAQTRVKGAAALRNEKQQALLTLLEQLRTYVQSMADASPENGRVDHPERGHHRAQDAGPQAARLPGEAGKRVRHREARRVRRRRGVRRTSGSTAPTAARPG